MKNLIVSVASAAALLAIFILPTVRAHGQIATGDIAKARGGPLPSQLTVYDRQGNVVRTVGEAANETFPAAFSPDGTRVAVVTARPDALGTDISVFDLSTGARTPIMAGAAPRNPVWSPDGRQIAYYSYRQSYGALYRKASNGSGSEELLYRFPPGISDVHLTNWSPDGRFLAFDVSAVVWVLPLAGERKAVELMRESFQVFGARFSPDSRFLAYVSDESGRNEVYARAFDPVSLRLSPEKRRMSTQGGEGMVHWRHDGRELYYLAPDGGVMAADVTTTPTLTSGPPKLLFRAPSTIAIEGNPDDDRFGRISRDGQRVAFQVRTPPDRKVITVASEILARYTGTYVSNRGNKVVVTLEGNQLMAETPGGRMCPSCGREKFPYFAESETYFFDRHPDSDADVEFVKDDKGTVTHFLAYQGGPGTRWTRTEANAKAKGGPFPRQLTFYDRQGKVLRTAGEPTPSCSPGCALALSPDGTRLAVIGTTDPGTAADISVLDLSTGARTQVLSGPARRARDELVMLGAFSPDGSEIAYFSYRHGYGGLYRKASNGAGREQLLYRFTLGVDEVTLSDWSDGRCLAFQIGDGAGVLWVLPLTGERQAVELVREEFSATDARLSPTSRFLAYGSNESGRSEVYVRAFDPSLVRFPPAGGKWQVSDQGGTPIQWRQDGGELYYRAADGAVMAVEVTATPAFKAGLPKLLFRPPAGAANWSISRDGQRFAFRVPVPPERKVVTITPEILAQYTGTYVNPEGNIIPRREPVTALVVTLEGNQLMLEGRGTGGLKLPLFAESETYFFLRTADSDSDFEFVKDEKGVVTHFNNYFGGPVRKATRN